MASLESSTAALVPINRPPLTADAGGPPVPVHDPDLERLMRLPPAPPPPPVVARLAPRREPYDLD
jgi:hypothetical protein